MKDQRRDEREGDVRERDDERAREERPKGEEIVEQLIRAFHEELNARGLTVREVGRRLGEHKAMLNGRFHGLLVELDPPEGFSYSNTLLSSPSHSFR